MLWIKHHFFLEGDTFRYELKTKQTVDSFEENEIY